MSGSMNGYVAIGFRRAYSVAEVAALMGLPLRTVYLAVERGQLPSVRIGRRILVPASALEQLLSKALPAGDKPVAEGPAQ